MQPQLYTFVPDVALLALERGWAYLRLPVLLIRSLCDPVLVGNPAHSIALRFRFHSFVLLCRLARFFWVGRCFLNYDRVHRVGARG